MQLPDPFDAVRAARARWRDQSHDPAAAAMYRAQMADVLGEMGLVDVVLLDERLVAASSYRAYVAVSGRMVLRYDATVPAGTALSRQLRLVRADDGLGLPCVCVVDVDGAPVSDRVQGPHGMSEILQARQRRRRARQDRRAAARLQADPSVLTDLL